MSLPSRHLLPAIMQYEGSHTHGYFSVKNLFSCLYFLFLLGWDTEIQRICSTALEKLPFDVRNNKTIPYEIGQSAKLKRRLEKDLQALIQGG